MSVRLDNFRAVYLLPYLLDGTGVPDRDLPGQFRHELVVSAFREREVMQEVRHRGGVLLEIHRLPRAGWWKKSVSRAYKQQFLQAVTFNVQAGVSPDRSLEQVILGESGENRVQLNIALNTLKQGKGFIAAVEALDWFDETTLAILRAGEQTGQLGRSLQTTVEHFGRQSQSVKLMFGAVIWTALDILFALSTIVGMRFGLLPKLAEEGIKTEDLEKAASFKASVKVAIHINDVLLLGSAVAIALVVAIVVGYNSNIPNFRRSVNEWIQKMPLISQALLHSSMALTCEVMTSLLRGGVTFLNAVRITRQGTRITQVSDFWEAVRQRANNGEAVGTAFSQPLLNSSERMILRSHSDQEQLATTLQIIAANREELAKKASKQFAVIAFVASLVYSGVAVLVSLWVVYLQNETVIGASV